MKAEKTNVRSGATPGGLRTALLRPLPSSKVRTWFEGAQGFSKVRILENLGDFFEDAHPFPRCARKVRIFGKRICRHRNARGRVGRAPARQMRHFLRVVP
jgi:hypothetical protein